MRHRLDTTRPARGLSVLGSSLVALAAAGAVLLGPVGASGSAASAATSPAAAATGAIEGYGAYQPQVSCDPNAKVGTVALRNLVTKRFGGGDSGIVRSCGIGGASEHKEGRAWDWRVNASSAADRQRVDKALKWLMATRNGEPAANARRLGIMYVIWDKRIWGAYSADEGWRPYSGSSTHRDHVHFSLTWNGATERTSWWTGEVMSFDYGPCAKFRGQLAAPWRAPRTTPCPTPLNQPRAVNGVYRAQAGETPARVARFFHKPQAQIRRLNGWPAKGAVDIAVGEKIRVAAKR